jgi:hypothetical protein
MDMFSEAKKRDLDGHIELESTLFSLDLCASLRLQQKCSLCKRQP